MKVIVEVDGGSRGNPGPAGFGCVVLSHDRSEVLAEHKQAIGITTNKVAESLADASKRLGLSEAAADYTGGARDSDALPRPT